MARGVSRGTGHGRGGRCLQGCPQTRAHQRQRDEQLSAPGRWPATALHSAHRRASVVTAMSSRGEDHSACSLLTGASQAHGAGLSIAPFFLAGAEGGGRHALCQWSQWPEPHMAASWRPGQRHPPPAGTLPVPKLSLFSLSGVAALSWLHSGEPGKNGIRS